MMAAWLTVLAFVFRTSALVCLLLLYRYFWQSTGPVVGPLRTMLACFIFLLLWVEVASIAELVGYMANAHALVEHGTSWIAVPNLVITVGLARMLFHLYQQGPRS